MKFALLFLVAATLRGPVDVATLTRASDAVVHARVVRRASAWGAGGPSSGVIYTRVTLAPIEWWKGGPGARGARSPGDAPHEIVVRVPGGAVGEIDQAVQGVARFGDEEEVVVFLRRLAPGIFGVERWALGKFAVGASAGAGAGVAGAPARVADKSARAVRDRTGVSCVGCRAGEEDDLALDDLRARVRGSLRR